MPAAGRSARREWYAESDDARLAGQTRNRIRESVYQESP